MNSAVASPKFTPEEIENVLTAYSIYGSPSRAKTVLKDQFNIDVSTETIRTWAKGKYAQKFLEISTQHTETVRTRLAMEHEQIASEANGVALQALELLSERLEEEGRGRDLNGLRELAATVKHISGASTAHQSSADRLRGRPTHITENKTDDELMRQINSDPKMRAFLGQLAKANEAEKVPDATVVEETFEDKAQSTSTQSFSA